ncbi:MAG: hypothetical protein KDC53_21285 [Saprospiraceae bacterium]|nr:hypothetical protein [Saprospiraceae bacterium]
MRSILALLTFLAFQILMSGCNPNSAGFALPEGDFENGKINFVGMACNQCHSVDDLAWEGLEGKDVHFRLGGEVGKVKTYGDLVTSIINPSHRIARSFRQEMAEGDTLSPMPNYNEVMTVQELVDLVTFLEKQYRVTPPQTIYYTW